MIYLSNGLAVPDTAIKTPYKCIRMDDVLKTGVIDEQLKTVEKLQENDYIPLKNRLGSDFIVPKTFKASLEYSSNTFRNVFPEDGQAFYPLKKMLKKEYLTDKDKDILTEFIKKNNLPYKPERLAQELAKIFYGKIEDYFNPTKPLTQLACILTLGFSREYSFDGLKGLIYEGLEEDHKKDLKFFFDSHKIRWDEQEDSLIVICGPFLEYYHYFFNEAILNLPLRYLDSLINLMVSILGSEIKMSKRASYSLALASLHLFLLYREEEEPMQCPVMYRRYKPSLEVQDDKCYEVFITTVKEDHKRIYQDYIMTEDDLLIRVIHQD